MKLPVDKLCLKLERNVGRWVFLRQRKGCPILRTPHPQVLQERKSVQAAGRYDEFVLLTVFAVPYYHYY